MLTDNQVLQYFFIKQDLSRREARWLDFLSQFGITKLTLVKGRVHALGDTPSRAPHVNNIGFSIGNTSIITPALELPENFIENYHDDLTFSKIYQDFRGKTFDDKITIERVSRMMKFFKIKDELLYYEGMICVPRKNIKHLMDLAHDNKLSGHFGYTKTLARLARNHWKNKPMDVFE